MNDSNDSAYSNSGYTETLYCFIVQIYWSTQWAAEVAEPESKNAFLVDKPHIYTTVPRVSVLL